jgi:hypothetical protein
VDRWGTRRSLSRDAEQALQSDVHLFLPPLTAILYWLDARDPPESRCCAPRTLDRLGGPIYRDKVRTIINPLAKGVDVKIEQGGRRAWPG